MELTKMPLLAAKEKKSMGSALEQLNKPTPLTLERICLTCRISAVIPVDIFCNTVEGAKNSNPY